jgi:hypothetical protein
MTRDRPRHFVPRTCGRHISSGTRIILEPSSLSDEGAQMKVRKSSPNCSPIGYRRAAESTRPNHSSGRLSANSKRRPESSFRKSARRSGPGNGNSCTMARSRSTWSATLLRGPNPLACYGTAMPLGTPSARAWPPLGALHSHCRPLEERLLQTRVNSPWPQSVRGSVGAATVL